MHDLARLFDPASIAIIGASSDETKLGGRPVHFLKTRGFQGPIYPVNSRYSEIQGLKAFPSITDIPGDVDQAVVVVPAPAVEEAVLGCAAKGIKMVQVLSSGLGEEGGEGLAMQNRIVSVARASGMRLTGPNSLGAVSPSNGLYATFSSAMAGLQVKAGTVAFATQSGAFGSCAYVMASLRGLGISRVIATGNEADVDVAECIEYLAGDPQTEVICAAIEGCADGGRLRKALREAARVRKPLVIMKVGTTEIGASAAATHTGSLAGDDQVFDTVFRECGAWRTHSIEEMIDVAYLLSTSGMPANDRAGIVTISGGIGVLMADAATSAGLSLPKLPAVTRRRVKQLLPCAMGDNPLDVTAQIVSTPVTVPDVGAEILRGTDLASMLLYLANDALAPDVFLPVQEALIRLKSQFRDRLIVCVMPCEAGVRSALESVGIPIFEDPTRAVNAIAGASSMRNGWQATRNPVTVTGHAPPLPESLDEVSAKGYLAMAGVPLLEERLCASPEYAMNAADDIGYPVVLKIVSPQILHKTEVGGVATGIPDRAAVGRAYTEITQNVRYNRPDASITGVLVSPMATGGLETIIGLHTDPIFGAMVMFGMGGVTIDLYHDVAFASAPVTAEDARHLIDSVTGAKLLGGWRGALPFDRQALIAAICRVSELGASSSEIASIDINPFTVFTKGAVALDAAILKRR